MIKLVVAVKRKAGLSPQQFRDHWLHRHAALVRACPATGRYIRRYVQCHTRDEDYADGEPPFDGTAELWFDTVEDCNAFYSDPDYIRDVHPDEECFADMDRTVFFRTDENTVL